MVKIKRFFKKVDRGLTKTATNLGNKVEGYVKSKAEERSERNAIYKEAYKKEEKKALRVKAVKDARTKYSQKKKQGLRSARIDPRNEGMFTGPSIMMGREEYIDALPKPKKKRVAKKRRKKKTVSQSPDYYNGYF